MGRMRTMIVVLAVVGLTVLTVAPALAAPVGPYDVGDSGFIVYFHGVVYSADPAPDGTSTWYYSVESGGAHAISHFLLEWDVEACCDVAGAGVWGVDFNDMTAWPTGPDYDAEGTVKVGYDGNTGYSGIKFNHQFYEGETFKFYFTLEKSMPVSMEGLRIVVKAGTDTGDLAALSGGGLNGGSGLAEAPMSLQSVSAQQEGVHTLYIPGPDFEVCGYTTAVTLKSFSADSADAAGSSFLPSMGMFVVMALLAPISAVLALGGRSLWRRR